LRIFASVAAFFAFCGLALGWPSARAFFAAGIAPSLPTFILCASLVLLALVSLACGALVHAAIRGRRTRGSP
jgi:hypothetical protein